MRSTEKVWFTKASYHAGWLSTAITAAWLILLSWFVRDVRPDRAMFVYLTLPVSLGCLAVAALNWRRWHSFRESMAASVMAVVNTYILLLSFIFPILVISLFAGRFLIALMVILIYVLIPLAIYVLASFAVAVPIACGAGAILYGLLLLMKHLAEAGNYESEPEAPSSRALRMLV